MFDGKNGWLCLCNFTLERVCYQVILIIFHKKLKRIVCIFKLTSEVGKSSLKIWAYELVSLLKFLFSRTMLLNHRNALIQVQITFLNVSKSARVYNRSLSSLHSTVCDNKKIVNLENKVAELVEMHWFKCKLSLQIYKNLPEFTIGTWVPPTRLLTGYNSILR